MKLKKIDCFRNNEKIAVTKSVWYPCLVSHSHDFFEVSYITKGNGFHILNGMQHEIKAGSLFLVTQQSEHNLIPKDSSPLEWINVLFDPCVISPELIDFVDTGDILKALISEETLHYKTEGMSEIELISSQEQLLNIFESMFSEYSEQKDGYQNILKAYLEILLVKIFREYFYNPTCDTKISQKIINYLKEHSFKELDIKELTLNTFYSPEYFRKLFKSETGIPLSQFIRNERLKFAEKLLKTTDLPIEAIMEKCGFRDKKSFYTAFKRMYGTTPGNIRQNSR